MILILFILIAWAVIYLLAFPLGALLCRYVPLKLTAIVNIILGIIGPIFTFANLFYSEVLFAFVLVYIYIPNLILYFKMRSLCRRNGVEKEKSDIKSHVRLTTFLTACYFPSVFISFISLTLLHT